MATSGPVITAFSDETQDPPSTADRMLRVLRPLGMAPMGQPGRGKTVGHFTPFYYACLILGYAGAQPSDAATAAQTLLPFEWHSSYLPSGKAGPKSSRIPGTLGEVLEAIIRGHGATPSHPYAPDLLLSLAPPIVEVRWTGDNGLLELIERYGPRRSVEYTFKNGGIRRQTLVKSSMIALAASLWRDTPTNKSAGSPAREPAP
jgi:hypothetical protein